MLSSSEEEEKEEEEDKEDDKEDDEEEVKCASSWNYPMPPHKLTAKAAGMGNVHLNVNIN